MFTNEADEVFTVLLIVDERKYTPHSYLLLPLDSSSSYSIYYSGNPSQFHGFDYFIISLQLVPPPKMNSYFLSEDNYRQYIQKNLSKGNVIFEIGLDDSAIEKGYHFEIFFLEDSDLGYSPVYYDNLTNYMGRLFGVPGMSKMAISVNCSRLYLYIRDVRL
uniref:Uncharacterized protein n=1 Tax=Panagrolaimus sp. JU765 TaxID=591449 RepID=A0AC34RHF6_9BILA